MLNTTYIDLLLNLLLALVLGVLLPVLYAAIRYRDSKQIALYGGLALLLLAVLIYRILTGDIH